MKYYNFVGLDVFVEGQEAAFEPSGKGIKAGGHEFTEIQPYLFHWPRVFVPEIQREFFIARNEDMNVPVGVGPGIAAGARAIQRHARPLGENLRSLRLDGLD